MAEGSPTVRRRELGTLLRELRKKKDLTVDQVAAHLECSASKISRIETGQRGAIPRDVRDLCDLYGVTEPAERDRLVSLAREGKQQGWWQSYDLPYSTYVGLEAEAVSIRSYNSAVVPGLLQTAGYVRGLHEDVAPQLAVAELTPEVISGRVKERLRRQELLRRKDPSPLQLWVMLDESVLHRIIGSPDIMRAQLRKLIDDARMPNLRLQVIPYTIGAHPALGSTFDILEFDKPLADVIYTEGLAGWLFLEKPEDIARHKYVFERLAEIALPPDETLKIVEKAIASLVDVLPGRVLLDHKRPSVPSSAGRSAATTA